ncbi:restriction endonuclease subunit S [Marinobacter salarius]|uniref:restriction endonuclease subunit S n=1 Tax=Marinobacter salarius TaxID=1420917 RepID=UPI003BA8FE2D
MSNTIPEGWSIAPIGDICNIAIGGTPSRSVPKYWDSTKTIGSPWVSIRDLNKPWIYETSEWITDAGIKHSNVKPVRKGTVLMSFKLSVGRVAFAGRDLYTNEAIAAFLPQRKNVYSDQFLYQGLQHWNLLENIDQAVKGATLNKEKINQIEAILPPLPEQKEIAAILSSVDDVIEKTRAQIDKLKDLKTGMMQELLTKGIGSGGVPHTEFKESPVGRIPACWAVRKADDISDAVMVGVVIKPTQYYVDQGVPALRSANVRENGLTMDNLKYFSPESNDQLHKSKLRKGDLLTVRTGYPGTTAVVTTEFEGCNCIDVVITRPSAEMDSDFFCLWVNSDHGKGQVLKAQGGLAQQHFNVGDMKNLLVPVPPLEEQRDIFRAVDSVIKKLSTSEKRLARLSSLKKALMQDLLTGKVRVNVSEKETAVA